MSYEEELNKALDEGAQMEKVRKSEGTKELSTVSLVDRIVGVIGAFKRIAESDSKTVWASESEVRERVVCCTTCTDKNNCPYCGCRISKSWYLPLGKSELNTEGCPNPKTYPHLKSFPPRNYWSVCKEKTSVIICARNESDLNLNRTIKSVKENATGNIEVILVLDGYNAVLDDLNIKVHYNPLPIGRRKSINRVMSLCTGEYLFILDAHCKMSYGWDTKLKCACGPKDIAISMVQPIDENFNDKNGCYGHVYLDDNFTDKWWHKKPELLIEQTMGFTGCGFMIRKDNFIKLGCCSKELGQYGYNGSEWSIKVGCNGGSVLLRKDVICGHLFSTNINGQLYKPKMISQQKFKSWVLEHYGDRVQSYLDKFPDRPVNKNFEEGPITIVRGTDDSCKSSVVDYCFENLRSAHSNNTIITTTKPANQERHISTYYKQLLLSLLEAKSKYVFVAEQDVIYAPEHFMFKPERDDTFYYETPMVCLTKNGWLNENQPLLSMCCANRELMMLAIVERLEAINKGWSCDFAEFGINDPTTQFRKEEWSSKVKSVDIRHGNNYTGDRTGDFIETVEPYGNYRDLLTKLGME